ncbi:glycosyltransferase family 4 protein [Rufibacter roseus]|uniref:Glycosyltransferase family 4 protein n=1 Tax=Rufibacter roseus TaxID=1567108 RepID=A0ABW2DNB4_9BACT|nr:glycosyltransferase family 4 protein [Rufibacter roseus]
MKAKSELQTYSNTKTAIVHEWLSVIGGSEKVLEDIHKVFGGPIYTLVKNEEVVNNSYFKDTEIHTSFIHNLPFGKTAYRNYLPLFPLAIEQFDLSDFEIIISSSHSVAKGVLTTPNQLHICYCHSPMRYAWDLYHQYLRDANLGFGIKGLLARSVLHYIRTWDVSSVNRVDHFIANSNFIARRIKKIYNREAVVIYPPVDLDKFTLVSVKENYYLAASRLVPYKRIDLIVEAFSKMPDKKLVVIGDGPDLKLITEKAKGSANVQMLGFQSSEVLIQYMQKAKAFVFAAEEDFGIMPVEAQACGTPVIALGKGGSLETVTAETGVFFKEQTAQSLIEAVQNFELNQSRFDSATIRQNAERFSRPRFISEIKDFILQKHAEFKS